MPHERFIDELLLLNLSEEFFEDEGAVEFARNLMLQNPHPQEPEAFVRQLAGQLAARCPRPPRLALHARAGDRRRARHPRAGVEVDASWPSSIPGAKLVVLDKAPHGLTMERAQEFNQLVLDFVAEHEPAAV